MCTFINNIFKSRRRPERMFSSYLVLLGAKIAVLRGRCFFSRTRNIDGEPFSELV